MKNCKFSPVIVYKLMLYEFANKSSSTTATGIADAYAFCFSPKVVIKVGTVEPFLAISCWKEPTRFRIFMSSLFCKEYSAPQDCLTQRLRFVQARIRLTICLTRL